MKTRFTLKRIKGDIIVTENGVPKTAPTLIEVLRYIFKVKHDESLR